MSFPDLIPNRYAERALETGRALAGLNRTLIAAHVNLDGDALGSLAACGQIFRHLGREFVLYSSSGIPGNLEFFPLSAPVYTSLAQLPFKPQSALYLDFSDPKRAGPELAQHVFELPSVNIDHHPARQGLGSICNFIEPEAAATAQIVAYVAGAMDIPLAGELASGIALGLITDTGGFTHGNTTTDVFSLCARLSAAGCSFFELQEKLRSNWRLDRLKLWGQLFCRVSLEAGDRIAICAITRRDMEQYHCSSDDFEGLVEWFLRLRNVKVAALMREEAGGSCKFSLRSSGRIDVRAMAAKLGGGGHVNAAGGTVRASIKEARQLLLQVIEEWLNQQENNDRDI